MDLVLSFPPLGNSHAPKRDYVLHPRLRIPCGEGTLLVLTAPDDLLFCHEAELDWQQGEWAGLEGCLQPESRTPNLLMIRHYFLFTFGNIGATSRLYVWLPPVADRFVFVFRWLQSLRYFDPNAGHKMNLTPALVRKEEARKVQKRKRGESDRRRAASRAY